MTLVRRASAKVNLFLELIGKRADGYHELVTVMAPLRLADDLSFAAAAELHVSSDDPLVPSGPENLAWRAAALLRDHTGKTAGMSLRLLKKIPAAAGLGGGSSDAATTLLALNELWNTELSDLALEELAARLGSDIPFFIRCRPAVCRGRGELLAPIRFAHAIPIVLAVPREGLNTGAVYRRAVLPTAAHPVEPMLNALADGDLDRIGRLLHNRLEAPATAMCPVVVRTLEELKALGKAFGQCTGVAMSGSGTSCFAVLRTPEAAETLAAALLDRCRELQHSGTPLDLRLITATEILPHAG